MKTYIKYGLQFYPIEELYPHFSPLKKFPPIFSLKEFLPFTPIEEFPHCLSSEANDVLKKKSKFICVNPYLKFLFFKIFETKIIFKNYL